MVQFRTAVLRHLSAGSGSDSSGVYIKGDIAIKALDLPCRRCIPYCRCSHLVQPGSIAGEVDRALEFRDFEDGLLGVRALILTEVEIFSASLNGHCLNSLNLLSSAESACGAVNDGLLGWNRCATCKHEHSGYEPMSNLHSVSPYGW